MFQQIVFVAAKRTPFGAFGGSFKDLSATDLAVHASKAALEAAGIAPSEIDHAVFGNVLQTSADAAYLARHVALRSGVPEAVPAVTVNRLCGSGFEAVADGANRIALGQAKCVLAGGAESMSQAPYVLRKARFGYRLSHGEMEDSLTSALSDSYAGLPMAMTAEGLAEDKGLTRAECDAFALESQKRAGQAASAGHFKDEIAEVVLQSRGKETRLDRDEHMRPDATLDGLAKLKPVFKKEGVVTAGNASGMVDGAAALVLTTRDQAKSRGWAVLGELVDFSVVGCDPKRMGIGPVPAVRRLLEANRLKLADVKWLEINEAFAAQYLAVERELGNSRERTNPDGGAIAIGHPLGATGARLIAHALYGLKRAGGGWGVVSACIGGGQGMACLLKV
jgi:acetyl-CoA acyltransferase 2